MVDRLRVLNSYYEYIPFSFLVRPARLDGKRVGFQFLRVVPVIRNFPVCEGLNDGPCETLTWEGREIIEEFSTS